jgi:hypothetical protein
MKSTPGVTISVLLLCGAGGLATVSAQESAARQAPSELRENVEGLTGEKSADCGLHFLAGPGKTADRTALRKSVACAEDAAKNRRPFWTFKQEQGIDSLVFQGLLGTANGTIYSFSYDSAPCGGPGCAGQFTAHECEKPRVIVNKDLGALFECQAVRRHRP